MFLVTNNKVVLNTLFPLNCETKGNNEKQLVTRKLERLKLDKRSW